MMHTVFDKNANAALDYSIDWSAWLGTDSISASSWSVPSGITQVAAGSGGAITTVWLSGGTSGSTYRITNTITTSGGRTDFRYFDVCIR